jgi:hypothetical protein
MSANACIVFFGLRFEVSQGEIEALELRSDTRMQAARKAGLKHYWSNFGLPGERYVLFIGAQLGVLGPENSAEVILSLPDLQSVCDSTRDKLAGAGLIGEPSLFLQWRPDA